MTTLRYNANLVADGAKKDGDGNTISTTYAKSASLATVATSGAYSDLSGTPTIPAAQVQADWNETNTSSMAYIQNKPTIPSGVVVDQTYDGTSTNAQSGVAIAGELTNYALSSSVPTDTSDLTNGAGFITGISSTDVTNALGYTPYDSSNPSGYTTNTGTVTSVNNISPVNGNVTISIPSDTNDLTNGAGYITGISGSDVTTALGYTPADTSLSNLGVTSSANFDGQYVYSLSSFGTSTSIGNYTIDLNTYLPNVNGIYEVLLWVYNYNTNSSTSNFRIWSDVITSVETEMADKLCWLNANSNSRFQCAYITMPVTRYLYYSIEGRASQDCRIVAMSYRRVGTNS